MNEHKISYGPVHDWDCPPCVEAYHKAEDYRASIQNPHRPGTKVHERFEKERYQGLRACDPRSELYWTM
jgi:hypothetical protein